MARSRRSYRTALAFMSTFSARNALRIGQFAPLQTRADARRLFEAARAAMDTCGRLVGGSPIVYPRVDPIVTYVLQPEDDRWSLVKCVRIHAGAAVPSIECTLDGIYVFGSGGVYKGAMIRGLRRVLEESEGEAAWRARGLIAATAQAFASRGPFCGRTTRAHERGLNQHSPNRCSASSSVYRATVAAPYPRTSTVSPSESSLHPSRRDESLPFTKTGSLCGA